jgi:PAS domain-containing protein
MSFAATMLLWVMPLALLSLVAGLAPSLLQEDERTPLLQAHYGELAATAAELVRMSREPELPLDGVTTALRRHAGVASARIVGAEGRVLAPLNEAGTRLDAPPVQGSAPRITLLDSGLVDLTVPASTGDGRSIVVALSVDPARIHPATGGSPAGIVSLLVCLVGAWAVARKVTRITDARLSRLGEEVELMTTRQVTVGRDPFGLRGGQRILDAATFALSPTFRRHADAPRQMGPDRRSVHHGDVDATALIEADAAFRIVRADAACEILLGVAPDAVRGVHLVDALHDDVLVNEVLRLVTLATTDQPARGEALPGGRGDRLGIEVTRRPGPTPLTICFTRL